MWHFMKYDLLVKLRKFDILFWPLIFPLVLATFFQIAFGQINEADFDTVPAALVRETQTEGLDKSRGVDAFEGYLEALSGEEPELTDVKVMSESEALKALEKGDIAGIFYTGEKPSLTVSKKGMEASILQAVLESYLEGQHTLEEISATRPEGMRAAITQMKDYQELVQSVSLGGTTTNGFMQNFYALIGMACLYGCFIGFGSALLLQANLSALAARRCVTPTHKLKLILSEMLTSFGLHFFNVLILILYLRYVLHMEFNGKMPQMLLVILAGCMIGVSMGIFISSISRKSEGIKVAILLGVSMFCSFLAGLMGGGIKDMVENYCPIVNRINPAALISDAFYCINVYDSPERLKRDLLILAVMSVLLTAGSFWAVRRERYDSI